MTVAFRSGKGTGHLLALKWLILRDNGCLAGLVPRERFAKVQDTLISAVHGVPGFERSG